MTQQRIEALDELRPGRQWVLYNHDKNPKNPYTLGNAMYDVPGTWGTYEDAAKALEADRERFLTIGRVLIKEQEITCIDLDHCIDEQGNISFYARMIVKRLHSYTEYSPSGTGLHIWVHGNIPKNIAQSEYDGPNRLEMNDCKKGYTFTGKHLEGTPTEIKDRQDDLSAIHGETIALREEARARVKQEKPRDPPRSDFTQANGDTPYGLTALADECDKLARMAPDSGRNTQLNTSAFRMGQLVEGHELTRATVEQELSSAAARAGLDDREIEKTLRSGIEAGMTEPRSAPQSQNNGYTHYSPGHDANEEFMNSSNGTGQKQTAEDQDKFFTFLDFKDLRSLPKPKWLLYDVLPTKGVNFIYGARGCGKTYVATGIACAVATESVQWLERATKHGHVVYIAAEDIDEVAQRLIGWANYYNIDDIPNLHIFPCPLDLAKDTPKFMESLEHQYGKLDIVLFVIDTLAMCSLGVEENSKKDFDAVLGSMEMLWRTYNCCVAAIHHSGRNGEIRGTSSIDGVAYSLIKVSEVDDNVMLESKKKRRGKHFADIYLDRKIVEIPGEYDEMMQPVTTCVLVKSDREAAANPGILTKLQQEVLEHIRNLGGKNVPRPDVRKACKMEAKSQESSFDNVTSALNQKGLITQQKIKNRVSFSLVASDQEPINEVHANEEQAQAREERAQQEHTARQEAKAKYQEATGGKLYNA